MNKFLIATALSLVIAGSAFAAGGYQLYGSATTTSPGENSPTAVQLTSVGTSYSGIDFTTTTGLTFADLTTLSADYYFTQGTCGGGSPRFQVNVLDPNTNAVKNIFVYFGSYPNYNDCATNTWTSTGDLLANGLYVDTSQVGGTFYDTYENAVTAFGAYDVVGIQLVVDGGWAGAQTVNVDNVVINATTYTFENADTCKKGGWMTYTGAPGPFKNQGQCVSYYARGGE